MARDTTIDGIRIDSSGHAKLRAENYKKGNLCQFLGIDGRKYYNFLKTHISDKTYIGTKYSKNSYKDGANGLVDGLILRVPEWIVKVLSIMC